MKAELPALTELRVEILPTVPEDTSDALMLIAKVKPDTLHRITDRAFNQGFMIEDQRFDADVHYREVRAEYDAQVAQTPRQISPSFIQALVSEYASSDQAPPDMLLDMMFEQSDQPETIPYSLPSHYELDRAQARIRAVNTMADVHRSELRLARQVDDKRHALGRPARIGVALASVGLALGFGLALAHENQQTNYLGSSHGNSTTTSAEVIDDALITIPSAAGGIALYAGLSGRASRRFARFQARRIVKAYEADDKRY